MHCQTCSKEFTSTRKDAKYCSPKCRLAFHRKSETDNIIETDNATDETDSVTLNETDISQLSKDELYGAIGKFRGDFSLCPEKVELMRRLKEYPLKRLEEEGYFIPNWKRTGQDFDEIMASLQGIPGIKKAY